MTTTIVEGRVTWTFAAGWHASKYDAWAYYREKFQGLVPETKAVDIVAFDPRSQVLWLIEAKDYTTERRSRAKPPIWDEVAAKARDTLAGIFATALCGQEEEQALAQMFLRATSVRVVLHLEQPTNPSKLFPRSYDPADLLDKLRGRMKAVDAKALVVDCRSNKPSWSAGWTG